VRVQLRRPLVLQHGVPEVEQLVVGDAGFVGDHRGVLIAALVLLQRFTEPFPRHEDVGELLRRKLFGWQRGGRGLIRRLQFIGSGFPGDGSPTGARHALEKNPRQSGNQHTRQHC
jgi:hypothetical protein